MKKKGIFFSIDALIALMIILLSIVVVYPLIGYSYSSDLIQGDIIGVLSSLKIEEVQNSNLYVQQLISEGKITDLNKSVLEQIGEFYITNKTIAKSLSQSMLSTVAESENIGIWYGNEFLASKNVTSMETARNIETERQIISGMKDPNDPGGVTGYSAKASLSRALQKKYFYFGGYNGDGNISINLNYTGNLTDMSFEIAINDEFDLYINGQHSGHYDASPSGIQPVVYDPSYEDYFESGNNIIEIIGDNLHIAGGYIKIIYENSVEYERPFRYYFSGIEGLINIYDSFYIPGILSDMSVFLHYNSNHTLFLNIGNTTVFNGSSDGETSLSIDNAELSSKLDYSELSRKTIPLRLGLEEISGTVGEGVADIVFLIDSTGSMGGEINDVKDIISDFTYILENSSIDYRLGLIEFQDYPITPCGGSSDFPSKIYTFLGEEFTTDADIFRNTVDSIVLGWGNDYAESHLRALNESLDLSWRENAVKYNILLTDAPPHAVDCLTATWNYWWCSYCLAEPPWFFCGSYNTDLCVATYVSNDLACNLGPKSVGNMTQKLIDKGIKLFYINKDSGLCGNRIVADNMTNLTGGGYYSYTEVEGVQEIILEIAGEIVNITYSTQTAVATGNIKTKLYPDSYIYFNYTAEAIPYGLVTKIETEEFGNDETTGSFYVPEDSEIIEANVISYSGAKWTDNVYIYNESTGWENIFSLKDYGKDYIELGDPYVINIPLSYLKKGDNSVKITSGVSSDNSTGSSASDKAIYTIIRSVSGYSDISAFAEGCTWTIQFEDDFNSTINIPLNYSGTNNCCYQEYNHEPPVSGSDAIKSAVYDLLKKLDLDLNGKIDSKFTDQDLQITSNEITGIPYDWSGEIQIRKWY